MVYSIYGQNAEKNLQKTEKKIRKKSEKFRKKIKKNAEKMREKTQNFITAKTSYVHFVHLPCRIETHVHNK